MPQRAHIVLEQKRYFSSDIFYKIVHKQNELFFCRLKSRDVEKKSGDLKSMNSRATETELLHDRRSFKLSVSEISAVQISAQRSYWNNSNSGTVSIVAAGIKRQYIIYCMTTAESLKSFFESVGCQNITIEEAIHSEEIPSMSKGETKRVKRRLSPVAKLGGGLTLLIFLWIFFPVCLNAGIVVMLLLPFAALILLRHYRTYFKKTQQGPLDMAWTYLIIFVIIPPLALCVVLLRVINFILPPVFFILVPVVAIAVAVACLARFPKLRSKLGAIMLTLFAAVILASGVLGTDYLINVSTVANYKVTVQGTSFSTGGHRAPNVYYVMVGPVPGGAERLKMSVPLDVYKFAQTKGLVKLSLRSGLWGIKWYEIDLKLKK